MSIGMLIFWAAVGWCGTPWRKWPPPPPDPDPWWLIRVIAIIGGIVGGVLFNAAWPVTNAGVVEVVASGAGALVGSIILLDVFGFVRSMGRTQATS